MATKHWRVLAAAGLTAVAASAVSATPADDPLNDPAVQKTLRAMTDASTWYHPDLFGEYAGMRRYTHRQFAGAMKYFDIGAYYADKLSQLSIGLMYLNGEGVKKDPLTAYAWLDIAAEREYPEFVATRDRVKASLSADEFKRAQAIRDRLAARYADNVAKPRMEQQLRWGLEQKTGSHLGFDFGILSVTIRDNCSGSGTIVGGVEVPEAGCGGNVYAESRWDPKKYFAVRDAQWMATVTVGDINTAGKKPAAAQPSSQGNAPKQ